MNMIRAEFRKLSRPLVIWAAILCGMIFMYTSLFDSVKGMFEQKLNALPTELLGMFRMGDFASLASYNTYYATIFTFLMLAASCFAIITGVNLLIREEGDGTIEFLNAQPVTRRQIVSAKILASLFAMLLLCAAMIATSFFGAFAFSKQSDFMPALLAMTKICYLPIFVFLFVGLMLSSLLRKPSSAVSIALGLFFTTYILGAIGGMVEDVSFLKWISPIDYVIPTQVINAAPVSPLGGAYDYTGVFASFAIIIVCIGVTYFAYSRRNLRV